MIQVLLEKIQSVLGLFTMIRFTNILEILLIAVMIYYIILWFRDTRAMTLLKGIFVVFVFVIFAYLLQMSTILWLFQNLISVLIIAICVIFQPELRRALEQLGRKNILSSIFDIRLTTADDQTAIQNIEKVNNEIIRACLEMSRAKTGALIVLEQRTRLSEYERTGILLDSKVSSQLLINIFEKNTPLHDGAVFVNQDRIVAATCYLPLSDNMELSKELGTRHRAGVGISEVSDSVTLIVSEETGGISIAYNGVLSRDLSEEDLRLKLKDFTKIKNNNSKERSGWRRLIYNEGKNNK